MEGTTKLHDITQARLVIQSHSLGQVDITSQLLMELRNVAEIGERAINQPSLMVASTKYTGVIHNLAESYEDIVSDIKNFYTYAARLMTTSYRYLHDAWRQAKPNAEELTELAGKIKKNESFVVFVRNRSDALADELYRAFGRSLNNLHYSVYMKRNKGVEHKSNLAIKDAGILTRGKYLHYCINENKFRVDGSRLSPDIDSLHVRMRGLQDSSLAYSQISKFCLVDYNYFSFSNDDKETINTIRESCNTFFVPLPVTDALLNEILNYIGQVVDYIESKKRG